jgi:hypothetical protein
MVSTYMFCSQFCIAQIILSVWTVSSWDLTVLKTSVGSGMIIFSLSQMLETPGMIILLLIDLS